MDQRKRVTRGSNQKLIFIIHLEFQFEKGETGTLACFNDKIENIFLRIFFHFQC